MGRPRLAKTPQNYLDAWEVLPQAIVKQCLAALMGRKQRATRLITLAVDRVTQGARLLGEDLSLVTTNYLAERFHGERSWRLYFARDASVATPRSLQYAQAAMMLAKGYSRNAVAAALHLSTTTIQRNTTGTHIATKRRVQYPASDVAEGYRVLIAEGRSDLAADANLCGQVAELRRTYDTTS